ncbi:hypothetical protein Aduo_003368 [Ancylostoma duodenale]
MWQCFISCYYSVHYFWIVVAFTQVLIAYCSKIAKGNKQPSESKSPFTNKGDSSNASAENSKESVSKNSREKTAIQKESAEKGDLGGSREDQGGWDINKIRQCVEARQRDSTKTDLRSVQDVLYLYRPRNPIGVLPPKPQDKGLQVEQTQKVILERPEQQKVMVERPEKKITGERSEPKIMVERPDDRELSVLMPTDSFLNPVVNPSQARTMSVYDPLRLPVSCNLQKI